MSVRRFYELFFDGVPVFSGSKASVFSTYDAVSSVLKSLGIFDEHVLVVAFRPDAFQEVIQVSKRMRNRRADKKIFRRTAAKAKKINIDPKVYRGGIRL